jgi:dimethylaniline monooxygenase (N-oxide forming)
VSGARTLPPDYAVRARAEGDAETAYYRLSPSLRPLVDYPAFADSVAELVGCAPRAPNPLANPVRCFKYWTYPLWACWYRENGPGAAPDVLDDVLDRFPVKTSVAVSRGNSPAPFGVFPMLIIGIISACLQFAPSLLGLATGKFGLGFTPGWGWAKPKHRVLHRGQPAA